MLWKQKNRTAPCCRTPGLFQNQPDLEAALLNKAKIFIKGNTESNAAKSDGF
jgi:hypothetical protein